MRAFANVSNRQAKCRLCDMLEGRHATIGLAFNQDAPAQRPFLYRVLHRIPGGHGHAAACKSCYRVQGTGNAAACPQFQCAFGPTRDSMSKDPYPARQG